MRDAPIRKTFYLVFTLHLIALLTCFMASPPKEKKKMLRVRTISLAPKIKESPKAQTSLAAHSQVAKKNPTPVTAAIQPEKKTTPSTKPKAAPAPKKQSVQAKKIEPTPQKVEVKKNSSSKVSHLLKELEETVAKIDEKRDKLLPVRQLDAPKWVNPLKIDTIKEMDNDGGVGNLSYQESLVEHLKETLDLPEFGQVKIELTLTVKGEVLKLRVLTSESEKNRTYLEKNLQSMKFPPLEASTNEGKRTFVLTFCNEL